MGKNIKLYHIDGPFGDCTSAYSVFIEHSMTVEQFIDTVIAENPGEWGRFTLKYNKQVCSYSRGAKTILDLDFYNKVKDYIVIRATAHGGWSLMDYDLDVNEKVEEGDNNDISYHQFTCRALEI